MPVKKEADMKMIIAVLVARAIISMFEKNKKAPVEKKENRMRVIHPAEFEIR
jgi:hypothetical protein